MLKTNNNKINISHDYMENYQNAVNNYIKTIKFYTNKKQIINIIIKIINGYKESFIAFKKNLIQVKSNLIKPFYDEVKKKFKFTDNFYFFDNQLLYTLNQVVSSQINYSTNIINDIEKNLLKENSLNNDFIDNLQQKKNILQNNQKKMEKLYTEYNNEHKKFIKSFHSIENDIQEYYESKRNNENNNIKNKIDIFMEEANNIHSIYLQVHYKFKDNNKSYFNLYEKNMKDLEKEIIKNENLIGNNINFLLLTVINNNISFLNILTNFKGDKKITELFQKNNYNLINEEKKASDDYNLFFEQSLSKLEKNYEKEKYKVKAIHTRVISNKMSKEAINIINALSEEFSIEDYHEKPTLILLEEDVFNIVKFFYSFTFVDKTEYDLIIGEKKIEVINLTNKLLQPGLIKTKFKEYKDLLPINDEEIKLLRDYIGKNREYRDEFLKVINNYRTFGKLELPEREYDLIGNYFIQIIDCIFEEKSEKDFKMIKSTILMSQTFFVIKNNEKLYLIEKIKGHKLFLEIEYFTKYMKFCIEEMYLNNDKSKVVKFTKNKEEMLFSSIITFFNYMKELKVPINYIKQIIDNISKEYEMSEDLKNNINNAIESF
jgi:hypothetical protein